MLTLKDVQEGLFGYSTEAAHHQTIDRVVIDSRQVTPNSLFVAIRGGHTYVQDAFDSGAIVAITDQDIDFEGQTIRADQDMSAAWQTPLCIQTDDSIIALQKLATFWRKQFSPNVIGITGSIGKSSTKELTASVLEQKYRTLKSQGSYNNEIGLPFTLMQLDDTYQHVVLEMGMYDIGEIETLCQIAQPQVGLVTNIGPTHLERLGSIERIVTAKKELVEALDKDGIAILNYDDPRVLSMRSHTQASVFTYGLTDEADLWADQVTSHGLEGIRFALHHQDEEIYVNVPLLGSHSVHTALAATAVGLTQGLHWDEIVPGLQDPQAKLRLIALPGPRDSIILDDTYNASAESSIAALNLLNELDGQRKIAVLGDMAELGSFEETAHRKVGRRAAEVVDMIITVGPKSKLIVEEAIAVGLDKAAGICLDDTQAALNVLQDVTQSGDVILIKGSRSLAMESIVNGLNTDT